jgi:hypothetical protein
VRERCASKQATSTTASVRHSAIVRCTFLLLFSNRESNCTPFSPTAHSTRTMSSWSFPFLGRMEAVLRLFRYYYTYSIIISTGHSSSVSASDGMMLSFHQCSHLDPQPQLNFIFRLQLLHHLQKQKDVSLWRSRCKYFHDQ